MKTINLIAAMFFSVALSGPAADAGRIPLNGTMEASESYQSLPDPSLGFFWQCGRHGNHRAAWSIVIVL
jgi:hypothetical protein